MTATAHDALTAAISHVPLVAAAALAEAIVGSAGSMWPAAEQLAGSGWASATRLARGDARMGSGIAATNSREIARLLHVYRDAISGWLELLEATGGADPAAFEARFEAARQLLEPHDATDGQIEETP